VKLTKVEGKTILIKERFLGPNAQEEFDFSDCFIKQGQLKSKITNASESKMILLNTTYYRYIGVIASILNINIEGNTNLNEGSDKKSLQNLKQLFDGDDHQELKASL